MKWANIAKTNIKKPYFYLENLVGTIKSRKKVYKEDANNWVYIVYASTKNIDVTTPSYFIVNDNLKKHKNIMYLKTEFNLNKKIKKEHETLLICGKETEKLNFSSYQLSIILEKVRKESVINVRQCST